MYEIGKPIERETTLMVARGWRENDYWLIWDIFEEWWKYSESSDSFTPFWIESNHWSVHFKSEFGGLWILF